MNVKTKTISVQHLIYAAPETIALDMVADSILCGSTSTETLVEDDFDPWA